PAGTAGFRLGLSPPALPTRGDPAGRGRASEILPRGETGGYPRQPDTRRGDGRWPGGPLGPDRGADHPHAAPWTRAGVRGLSPGLLARRAIARLGHPAEFREALGGGD